MAPNSKYYILSFFLFLLRLIAETTLCGTETCSPFYKHNLRNTLRCSSAIAFPSFLFHFRFNSSYILYLLYLCTCFTSTKLTALIRLNLIGYCFYISFARRLCEFRFTQRCQSINLLILWLHKCYSVIFIFILHLIHFIGPLNLKIRLNMICALSLMILKYPCSLSFRLHHFVASCFPQNTVLFNNGK